MTTLKTSALSDSVIKTKWNEKYFSEAVDEMMSVNEPGIYRGGVLTAYSVPNQRFYVSFASTGDPDTFVLYRNSLTQDSQTVKMTHAVSIDMSSEFSGGGGTIPSNVTWYVGLVVDYQPGQYTTANIVVANAPVSGMVLFGVIYMTAGESVISNSNIDMSGSNRTVPRLLRKFIIPQNHTTSLSAKNYVQLIGKVYCSGVSAGKSNSLVRFCDSNGDPLLTTDGYAINAGIWYKNAVLTNPILSTDVDVNGCYDNPYVAFDFGDSSNVNYTGAITCSYFTLQGLDDISDGTNSNAQTKQPIVSTRNVYSDPLSTSIPASLSQSIAGGDLNETLKSFFSQMINKFEKKLNASSTWVLIWSDPDGAIPKRSYLYYQSGRLALSSNCTISPSGAVTAIDTANPVRVNIFGIDTYELLCDTPLGRSLDVELPAADWDYYIVKNSYFGTAVKANTVDFIYNDRIISLKDVGGGYVMSGTTIKTGFGVSTSQTGSAPHFNMSLDKGPTGITYASNMTAGSYSDIGLKRSRPIVLDISNIGGWLVGEHAYIKGGLSIQIANLPWNDNILPIFRASVRAWDSAGGNVGTTHPAIVQVENVAGECTITSICIATFGLVLPSLDQMHLILDIEAYYHTYGGY